MTIRPPKLMGGRKQSKRSSDGQLTNKYIVYLLLYILFMSSWTPIVAENRHHTNPETIRNFLAIIIAAILAIAIIILLISTY